MKGSLELLFEGNKLRDTLGHYSNEARGLKPLRFNPTALAFK